MLRWIGSSSSTSSATSTTKRKDGNDVDDDHADAAKGDSDIMTTIMPGSFTSSGGGGDDDDVIPSSGGGEGLSIDKSTSKKDNGGGGGVVLSPPAVTFSVPSIRQEDQQSHLATASSSSLKSPSNSTSMPEFKAPTISLSAPTFSSSSSSSSSAPSRLGSSGTTTSSFSSSTTTTSRPKPKPSHRAFPAEPVSVLNSNGRVVTMKQQSTLGSTLGLPAGSSLKPRKQRFVALEPGYSPLDWARLNREGDDYELRCGYDTPQKFTLEEVSEHATRNDAWSIFNGRVYNITPYLHYHPGGVGELMRVAGKDGTDLFMETHAWVNAELMLEGCLIGFLVK